MENFAQSKGRRYAWALIAMDAAAFLLMLLAVWGWSRFGGWIWLLWSIVFGVVLGRMLRGQLRAFTAMEKVRLLMRNHF